jgi:hypothetical protein
MKSILLLVLLTFSITNGFSQKKGKYLSESDPLGQLWEFNGDPEMAAPLLPEMPQQFVFLIPDGSTGSMLAAFEMEGDFACPTYAIASSDVKMLYLDIQESCMEDLTDADKFVAVAYKMSKDGSQLELELNGVKYLYKLWDPSGGE